MDYLDYFKVTQFSFACPQQFYVCLGTKLVGYIRLRHGILTCTYPNVDGEIIYTASPRGADGCFVDLEQQHFYLNNCLHSIAVKMDIIRPVRIEI
jgi:hypothetical protein